MTEIDILNKRLKETYGSDLLGRQYYRVVLSSKETEKRLSTFNDFYGHIFLREYQGVREAPKYTFLDPQYILEKIVYMPTKELVESDKGHYEIVWAFEDKKPEFWTCQALIRQMLFGKKWTKQDAQEMDQKERQKYKDHVFGYLSEQRPVESVQRELGEREYPAKKILEGSEVNGKRIGA